MIPIQPLSPAARACGGGLVLSVAPEESLAGHGRVRSISAVCDEKAGCLVSSWRNQGAPVGSARTLAPMELEDGDAAVMQKEDMIPDCSSSHQQVEGVLGERDKTARREAHVTEREPARNLGRIVAGDTRSWRVSLFGFLKSRDQGIVFVLYVALNVVYMGYIHSLRRRVAYSSTAFVLTALMVKLLVSIVAYFGETRQNSFRHLLAAIYANRRHMLLYILPAAAYAKTDALGVYALQTLDPSTFAVLYMSRIIFTMLLFQRCMRAQFHACHWAAMGGILCACVVKELGPFGAGGRAEILPTPTAAIIPAARAAKALDTGWVMERLPSVAVVLFMAQIVAFAAVYNEKLLKVVSVGLNLQNMAMYFWGLVAAGVFSLLPPLAVTQGTTGSAGETAGADISALSGTAGWDTVYGNPSVLLGAILLASYGLVTSYFVRSLDTIVREIAGGFQLVGASAMNYFVFGYRLGFSDGLAILLVIVSTVLYNQHSIKR